MNKKRTGAWSPAARAKAAATRAANRAKKDATPANVQDAIAFLLKAEAAMIKSSRKHFSTVEILAMLALNALRGEL